MLSGKYLFRRKDINNDERNLVVIIALCLGTRVCEYVCRWYEHKRLFKPFWFTQATANEVGENKKVDQQIYEKSLDVRI